MPQIGARRAPLLVAALLLSACGGQQHTQTSELRTAGTPDANSSETSDMAARSQAVLDDSIPPDKPGCSAAVGIDGKVVWTGARGLADVSTGTGITADTEFDIASVSKQFTATASLLLAEAGMLTLEDPLSKHVPELPEWAATVTLGELMHQTSGIPDYVGLLQDEGYQYSDRTTQADALRALGFVETLNFAPGTQFEYSNSNYLLLGEIVQRVSGEPLPQFLASKIFHPLDLAMSLNPGDGGKKAVSYEDGMPAAGSAWEQVGDGGITTTPTQLVRWADNYRTGELGGQRLLDAQLAGAVETEPGGGDRYGAGIYILSDGMLDHDGSWAGFVTAFRVSKDRRTALAISCNADDHDPEAIADELLPVWT